MKTLKLKYFKIKHLYKFQRHSAKHDHVIKKFHPKNNDIISILNTITPEKRLLRRTQNPKRLFLILTPNLPFGPDPELVKVKLFGSPGEFDKALQTIIDFFNIEHVEIQNNSRKLRKRKNFTEITLPEIYSLLKAIKDGLVERVISLSLFFNSNLNVAFLTTTPCTVRELLESLPESKKFFIEKNEKNGPKEDTPPTETLPVMRSPFTGEILSPDDKLQRDTILFVGNHSSLKPLGGFLFPFPYFNREIRIRENTPLQEKLPLVCTNCLACLKYCPVGIHPSYIYHHIERGNIEEAEKLSIERCILCEKCSFVCPAGLPLYQTIEKTLYKLKEQAE